MNVNEWGPGGWIFLHTTTFNYPLDPTEEDKNRYRTFFESVKGMLPCKYCRESFEIYMKYVPIDKFLESREGLTYWLFRMHNLVNEKIFKPKFSFDHVVKRYEKIRAGCSKLIRDGDKEKVFNSCQVKKNVKSDDISIFVHNSEKKYKKIIDEYVNKLYSCTENPNKEYLKYLSDKKIKLYDITYHI